MEEFVIDISENGDVKVEGHYVGRLDGFRFVPDAVAAGDEGKTLLAAANRVLRGEIAARAQLLAAAPDGDFALTPDRGITWRGGAVGRLLRGDSALAPGIRELLQSLQGRLRGVGL